MQLPFPVVLAHGALGIWDDLIFLGVITIFVGIMIFSWFRSRGDDFEATDLMPKVNNSENEDGERFELK